MPTLSSSNRSQLGYKLEGTYPTGWGTLAGGNGTLVDMLSETLDYKIENEQSKALRSDRAVADTVQIGASSMGGFAFEHKYKEYDPFYEGVLQSVFTAYGTNGVSAAIGTLNFAAGTITAGVAPTGNDAFTTLQKGQWFKVNPPAGASQSVKDYFNGRPFRVSLTTAPTATVITLDSATQIDTSKSGASMTNGFISSSRMANANTMKSYSLEVGHGDVSQYRQYLGMIPSKMSLEVGKKIVTGSFEFMGKTFTMAGSTGLGTPAAVQTYTPANGTRGVFDMIEGGASISVSTYIKTAQFSIDNTLRVQDAVGVFGAAGIAPGTFSPTGKLEVYFADATMLNKFIAGSASSLAIPILDVDGNGYVYYFPRIKYTAAKINAGGQDQDNMVSMDFQALPDITAGSDTLGKTALVYRVGAAV